MHRDTGVMEEHELSIVFVQVRGSGIRGGVRNPAVGMDREKREELATATRLKLQSSGWKGSTAFDRNGGGGERLERGGGSE